MDEKMAIRIIMKNGSEFTIRCEKFTVTKNVYDQACGFKWENATENIPMYIDFTEVAAVLRERA